MAKRIHYQELYGWTGGLLVQNFKPSIVDFRASSPFLKGRNKPDRALGRERMNNRADDKSICQKCNLYLIVRRDGE